jgi:hypothetical protein
VTSVATWPALPYEVWHATCDTLHAHTQVLGKLAVVLAPPEPQLQHAALRLTARGWETAPLPAPDGSGVLGVALDLHNHAAVAEHSDGRTHRIPLTPDRPVAEVTGDLLAAVSDLVGPVRIDPTPQEVPWTTPLDEDVEHATYDPVQVAEYFAAATQAALVLAALRALYRGRSTPVNAWWGTFDLAVSLFSGRTVDPPSNDFIMRNSANAQQIEVGWWPGDHRYLRAAFFAFAFPTTEGFDRATLAPPAARWDPELGEYLLDWEDVRAAADPRGAAIEFGRSAIRHGCSVCDWDPVLAASTQGDPRRSRDAARAMRKRTAVAWSCSSTSPTRLRHRQLGSPRASLPGSRMGQRARCASRAGLARVHPQDWRVAGPFRCTRPPRVERHIRIDDPRITSGGIAELTLVSAKADGDAALRSCAARLPFSDR